MTPLVRWVLDLLYPPKCMLCHRIMESSERAVCGGCDRDLPRYSGAPRTVRFFENAIVPFYYEGAVRDSILRFKSMGIQYYADQYAKWMAQQIEAQPGNGWDMVSWVPCSVKRRRERGFDQCKVLAAALAQELDVPCVATLKKVRETAKQSCLPDAATRRGNVLGAYKALCPAQIRDKRILVVDDVLTTGSTMSECGKMLRIAGAGSLTCAAIAAAKHDPDKRSSDKEQTTKERHITIEAGEEHAETF